MGHEEKVVFYVISGTGRCGSMLMAKLFSLAQNSVCEHETVFRHVSMVEFYKNNDLSHFVHDINEKLIPLIRKHQSENVKFGIASAFSSFAFPLLYKIFGNQLRIIHMIRRPDEFIRSALARGMLDESHPNYCNQLSPKPGSLIDRKWSHISPFEKTAWYWGVVNHFVLKQLRENVSPDCFTVLRIEDINLETTRKLYGFLQLTGFEDVRVQKLLERRINGSPKQFQTEDANPHSKPITFPAIDQWSPELISTMRQYTQEIEKTYYGPI